MSAIAYLRRRTIQRSLHGYLVWVGRAVGWWTIAYLAFWVVVFAIAGAETLVRIPEPLPAAVPFAMALVVALSFLALAAAGRTPPVIVDRRDLYRLGLAPTVPYEVLRLRLNGRRGLRLALGAVVGGLWSAIAPPLFHLEAPWAAPALALIAMAHADLAWLRYAGYRRADAIGRQARSAATPLVAVAVALAAGGGWLAWTGDPVAGIGLLASLTSAEPWVLLAPALLATLAAWAVRTSLAAAWPPRFAAQSLVLTQLQAMRTLQWLAGVAGFVSAREADAGERARLLAALHDRPGATRPRRSLRPPAADRPVWRAIAWRSATALWRRPRGAQALLVGWCLLAVGAVLVTAPALVGAPVTGLGGMGAGGGAGATAGTLGAAFVGAVGVLAAAWLVARVGAALLGPTLPRSLLPIEPSDRTRGRLTPGLWLLAAAAVPVLGFLVGLATLQGAGAVFGADPVGTVVASGALVLTVLLALEKYATWSGAAAGGFEATLIAALIASLPVLLLGMFGAPAWAFPTQVALAALLWWLPI
jgi:hypothetical protein